MHLTRRRLAAATLALGLSATLVACGAGDDPNTDDKVAEGTYSAGDLVLDGRPERIVSLSAAATEMLFAIGAGDQVVAVDVQSNHPADAPVTDLDAYTPNAEAVSEYNPDLVVLSHDQDDIVNKLGDIEIPVYNAPAATTIDDTYQQITDLGSLTGHAGEAADVNAGIKSDLEELTADLPTDGDLTAYYELDDQLFSLTSDTYAGSLLVMAGLTNIADEADDATETGGYPQLSPEFILDADPDFIFVSGEDAAADVATRDGWDTITAVKEGNVVALDPDVASRWGPRVVDLMRAITEAVA